MKPIIKLITFATPNYEQYRQKLHNKIMQVYPVIHLQKTEKDIDDNFIKENQNIFKHQRGYGYCLWKPYFILQELQNLQSNELLLYMDAQDSVSSTFFDVFINHMNFNDLFVFDIGHPHNIWTKRDCFVLMDCDTEQYHNVTQLEAGLIGLKQSNTSKFMMQEWLKYCKNENIITDIPNICEQPNFNGFRDHRYDQSILTNLFIKHNIKPYKLHNDPWLISYHCN